VKTRRNHARGSGSNNLAQEIVMILPSSTLTRHEMAVRQGAEGVRFWLTFEFFKENVFFRAMWVLLIFLCISRLCSNYAYI